MTHVCMQMVPCLTCIACAVASDAGCPAARAGSALQGNSPCGIRIPVMIPRDVCSSGLSTRQKVHACGLPGRVLRQCSKRACSFADLKHRALARRALTRTSCGRPWRRWRSSSRCGTSRCVPDNSWERGLIKTLSQCVPARQAPHFFLGSVLSFLLLECPMLMKLESLPQTRQGRELVDSFAAQVAHAAAAADEATQTARNAGLQAGLAAAVLQDSLRMTAAMLSSPDGAGIGFGRGKPGARGGVESGAGHSGGDAAGAGSEEGSGSGSEAGRGPSGGSDAGLMQLCTRFAAAHMALQERYLEEAAARRALHNQLIDLKVSSALLSGICSQRERKLRSSRCTTSWLTSRHAPVIVVWREGEYDQTADLAALGPACDERCTLWLAPHAVSLRCA